MLSTREHRSGELLGWEDIRRLLAPSELSHEEIFNRVLGVIISTAAGYISVRYRELRPTVPTASPPHDPYISYFHSCFHDKELAQRRVLISLADEWPNAQEWWRSIKKLAALKWTTGDQPAGSVTPESELSEYDKAKQYYLAHQEQLKKKYPGEYVAIWRGQVISHGNSFSTVAKEAYEQVGYQDIYIPKVGVAKKPLRFPSPRFRTMPR